MATRGIRVGLDEGRKGGTDGGGKEISLFTPNLTLLLRLKSIAIPTASHEPIIDKQSP